MEFSLPCGIDIVWLCRTQDRLLSKPQTAQPSMAASHPQIKGTNTSSLQPLTDASEKRLPLLILLFIALSRCLLPYLIYFPLPIVFYSPYRIGFLGLGLMGSGIVSNLLKMGHVVTVWNRTAEKVSFISLKYVIRSPTVIFQLICNKELYYCTLLNNMDLFVAHVSKYSKRFCYMQTNIDFNFLLCDINF